MTDYWSDRQANWTRQPDDARGPYDVDYARIVHSGSFRRLQGKTQILNLGDSDFYRTRLTHSLEVAQIAGGIVKQLKNAQPAHPACPYLPPLGLIQAAGFSHDLGHPPFGHGGEVALNYCMRASGGFEGNGQTLRLLTKLENFSEEHGSNLTRRVLLAVLKYPVPFSRAANPEIVPQLDEVATSIRTIKVKTCKPPKCFFDEEMDVVDWILHYVGDDDREAFQACTVQIGGHQKSMHKSFDCSIMDVADDIAYGVHDLEDAIALSLITEKEFRLLVPVNECAPFLDDLRRRYSKECGDDSYEYFVSSLFGSSNQRKRIIGRLVHNFITSVHVDTIDLFSEPLLRYRASISKAQKRFLDALQTLVEDQVILSPNVQHLEFKGQKMVVSVFEALASDPQYLLPQDVRDVFDRAERPLRIICDYVAGMTDSFLLKTYDRLFSPRMGSVFDKL